MALFKNKNNRSFNFGTPPDHDPVKFVSDPNDPSYKSYNDSLSLYNNAKMIYNQKNYPGYLNDVENYNRTINDPRWSAEVKKVARKPVWTPYEENVTPMSRYGTRYSRLGELYTGGTIPIPEGNIKPTGYHGSADSIYDFVYSKPQIPIFVEGTELANNAKKQIMLKNAGLYKGDIDGIWGNKSIAAMQEYERQQQNITQSQPTNQVVAPTTQQPTMEAKPAVPKVVSGISKNYGSYTSTSGESPNMKEFDGFGSSANTKGYYYTVRYTDGTTAVLTPSEYQQLYGSSNNKAFKKKSKLQ